MPHVVRRFEERDKEPILEIARKTWSGHDHLQYALDDWTSNPQSHLFVIESEGRTIAFAGVKLIESGKTGWMEGLRVHPDHRRKGLGWLMTEHLVQASREMGVKRLRFTTATINEAPMRIAERLGMEQLFQLNTFWKEALRRIKWSDTSIQVEESTTGQVMEVLSSEPSLLPRGIIVHHWYAFDATERRIQKIGEFAKYWIGRRNGQPVSLSLGFKHDTAVGTEWCCTIYAANAEAFLSALSVHLDMAKGLSMSALMCVHQPEFENLYAKVKWLNERDHEIRLVLFEKCL